MSFSNFKTKFLWIHKKSDDFATHLQQQHLHYSSIHRYLSIAQN